MSTKVDVANQFLDPLVGTPNRAAAFELGLRTFMQSAGRIANPYDRLQTGVSHLAYGVVPFPEFPERLDDNQFDAWYSMQKNWAIGPEIAVAGLRTVGEIYQSEATTAQHAGRVRKTTAGIMRYLHGAAFCDSDNGVRNAVGLRYGIDPKDPSILSNYVFVTENIVEPVEISSRAFVVEQDAAGQLDISPRYTFVRGTRACPATHFRVEAAGQKYGRSGLLVLLETIGNVAASEIYPLKFEMTDAIAG